jgi:hypothetical protein
VYRVSRLFRVPPVVANGRKPLEQTPAEVANPGLTRQVTPGNSPAASRTAAGLTCCCRLERQSGMPRFQTERRPRTCRAVGTERIGTCVRRLFCRQTMPGYIACDWTDVIVAVLLLSGVTCIFITLPPRCRT